jgi:hypothetical protein
VGDAVDIALDRDRSCEAGEGDGAVKLREGVVQGLVEPVARGEGADDRDKNHERGERDEDSTEDSAAFGLPRGFFGGEWLVGNYIGISEMGKAHGLIASVNGAGGGWSRIAEDARRRMI